MATRWRERVCEAEQAEYGRGVMGALLLVAFERRLPAATVTRAGRSSAAPSRRPP